MLTEIINKSSIAFCIFKNILYEMEEIFKKKTWLNVIKNPDRVLASLSVIEKFNQSVHKDIFADAKPPDSFDGELAKLGKLYFSSSKEKTNILKRVEKILRSAKNTDAFAISTERGRIRALPLEKPVFNERDGDMDRMQESGVEIGEGMRVLLASEGGRWFFVKTPFYEGWISGKSVGIIDKETLKAHLTEKPFYVIIGNYVFTMPSPDKHTSMKMLGMGARLPKGDAGSINGQFKTVQEVVKIPVRKRNGNAEIKNAYLSFDADVSEGYLKFTRRNILNEAFKLIGERYGWGDSFQARDCSSTIRSIFKTMGVMMPRNASEQERIKLGKSVSMDGFSDDEKLDLLNGFDLGDLLFMKGHVMMYFGKLKDVHYIFHNFHSIFYGKDTDFNGAYITPVTVRFGNGKTALSELRKGIKF